jgi:hypothetical protein
MLRESRHSLRNERKKSTLRSTRHDNNGRRARILADLFSQTARKVNVDVRGQFDSPTT